MDRLDQLTIKLACGAVLSLRVWVDTADCRLGDGRCPSAEDVATMIWMAMQEEPAPRRVTE